MVFWLMSGYSVNQEAQIVRLFSGLYSKCIDIYWRVNCYVKCRSTLLPGTISVGTQCQMVHFCSLNNYFHCSVRRTSGLQENVWHTCLHRLRLPYSTSIPIFSSPSHASLLRVLPICPCRMVSLVPRNTHAPTAAVATATMQQRISAIRPALASLHLPCGKSFW